MELAQCVAPTMHYAVSSSTAICRRYGLKELAGFLAPDEALDHT
jgi:hypothetical protein